MATLTTSFKWCRCIDLNYLLFVINDIYLHVNVPVSSVGACDCGQTYLASAEMQHASFWRQGSASLVATVFAMALWLGELLAQQLSDPFLWKAKWMHFSNHPGFQDFITKRNEAWSKLGTMSDQEDQDDEAKDKPRKREEWPNRTQAQKLWKCHWMAPASNVWCTARNQPWVMLWSHWPKSSWNHFLFCSRASRSLWNPGSHTRGQPNNHRPLSCSICLLGKIVWSQPFLALHFHVCWKPHMAFHVGLIWYLA